MEVNTNHCAVPGDQLELPGATRQRKTGGRKTGEKSNLKVQLKNCFLQFPFPQLAVNALKFEMLVQATMVGAVADYHWHCPRHHRHLHPHQ